MVQFLMQLFMCTTALTRAEPRIFLEFELSSTVRTFLELLWLTYCWWQTSSRKVTGRSFSSKYSIMHSNTRMQRHVYFCPRTVARKSCLTFPVLRLLRKGLTPSWIWVLAIVVGRFSPFFRQHLLYFLHLLQIAHTHSLQKKVPFEIQWLNKGSISQCWTAEQTTPGWRALLPWQGKRMWRR